MRVLLDESLPRRLARHMSGVEADSVFDQGWSGLKNGALLAVVGLGSLQATWAVWVAHNRIRETMLRV